MSQRINTKSKFPIKPALFWAVFSKSLHDKWTPYVWRTYWKNKPWTKYFTKFIKELAPKFGCYVDEPWFKIDVAYYAKGVANNPQWGEWAIEAAIELENHFDWTHELNKLMLVNAGLKVLIAYQDPDKIKPRLNEFAKFYASRKYQTTNCGWLFIFGPRNGDQDFMAFSFNGRKIIDITSGKKTIKARPANL